MTRPAVRPLTLPVLGVTVAVLALSGCGTTGVEEVRTPPGASADPGLRDLLPEEVREAGRLTVATDGAYAPLSFFAADGRTVTGFEPDLAAAMGDLLDVEVELVVTDFGTILDRVADHEVDVAMAAITDTAEREEKVDFVNYFSAGTSIVVQRGNPAAISELDDLCGQIVAVEEGTVQVDLLERTQDACGDDPIRIDRYATNDDALVEVRTGRAAAVLNDYPPAAYLATAERTRADYQLASDVQYEPGLYGIAVAQDRAKLRDALQATLEALLGSGAYQDVLDKWDVADGAVRTVSVNAGARPDR